MEFKRYIKTIFKPKVVRRAKAMNRRAKLRTSSQQEYFGVLEKSIGYIFSDKNLLKEALTHPGAIGLSRGTVKSNQRLEFLGDSILQAIITDAIFKKFDNKEEGELTKARIALTQGTFLSELSKSLGVPEFLILPKGAEYLRTLPSAIEDVLEALIGAIFIDSNFEKVYDVVGNWYVSKIDDIAELVQLQNPKGSLQELVAKSAKKIEYILINQNGPDHKKEFEVKVKIGDREFQSATASSKKAAESAAAKLALSELMKEL